ncbi:pentatricopeptide repeat-containing protein At3g62890-like [Aristolochia californica]|uniref:pentatricopeptide repeat-containing protein At3g62890-like n=1 Tax=Aristolochia californica TaxID=171875 RepID=UPI0035DD7990
MCRVAPFWQNASWMRYQVSWLSSPSFRYFIQPKTLHSQSLAPRLLHLLQNFRKDASCIKAIHAQTITNGLSDDIGIVSELLQSSCVDHALLVFNQIKFPIPFYFNLVIQLCSRSNLGYIAITLYYRMLQEEKKPNVFTFPSLVGTCADLLAVSEGTQLHTHIFKMGFCYDQFIQASLLHMYARFGDMANAMQVFEEIPVKNTVTWTALVNGYCKIGDLETAQQIFYEVPEKDVVTWSAMLAGYVQKHRFSDGLSMFNEMQIKGVEANESVLVSVLSASAHLGALDLGRWVHLYAERKLGQQLGPSLGTSLVDMYAKCGALKDSIKVFQDIRCKNILTWNALMGGFAMYGDGKGALSLFSKMLKAGSRPDEVTFLGLLGAFSHGGMVTEGTLFFAAMSEIFFVSPQLEHYACMVDLFSRAGLLEDAKKLIQGMPMKPDPCVWGALLGGCRVHKDVLLGCYIGKKLIECEPDHAGRYVLLSNIYASVGRWNDSRKVRSLMVERRVKSQAGCSSIEIVGLVHEFVAGDRSHPQTVEIYDKLEEMDRRLKMAGHSVNTRDILYDISEEDKEVQLSFHSERLAIAFGLVSTVAGTSLRIVKNLRVCGSCHDVAKLLSKIYEREILVRDSKRFHHFTEGSCSCMDYW